MMTRLCLFQRGSAVTSNLLGRRVWQSSRNQMRTIFYTTLPLKNEYRYPRCYQVSPWWRASSSVASQNHPNLELCSGGKKLRVGWSDGEESVYHSLWLRHNYRCSSCWNSSFEQKTIDGEVLQGHPTITAATVSDEQINIHWKYEGEISEHSGHFPLDWLKRNGYSTQKVVKTHEDTTPLIPTSIEKFSYKDIESNEKEMWRWLRHVSEYGFAVITDAPVIEGNIVKLVNSVGISVKNYYGEMTDLKALKGSDDLSYSEHSLPLHGDVCHFESPPGLQMIYCLKFDDCVEGGESILVDFYSVACEMREKYPHHFETLTRVPFNYLRHYRQGSDRVMMEFKKPPIVLNERGEIIALRYHPQSEGPLLASEEDVEKFYEAYTCLWRMLNNDAIQFTHRLRAGEVLTFNNRRMLHGRKSIKTNGGMRHLQVMYVIIDEFKSKVRVLASKFAPSGYQVKNIFNSDSL